MSPDEVGLSYQALLLRGVLTFFIGFICAVTAGTVVASLLRRFMEQGRGAEQSVLWSSVTSLAGTGLMLVVAFVPGLSIVARFGLGALGIAAFAALIPDLLEHKEMWHFVSSPRARLLVSLAIVGVAITAGLAIALESQAVDDRDRLAEGRVPGKLAWEIPPPWDASVVRDRWASDQAAANGPVLPRCLLLLGEANATSVFFDPTEGHKRTLKLPTSAVLVEILPNTDSALPPPQGSRSCA